MRAFLRDSNWGGWPLLIALGCGGYAGEGVQIGGETNWLATCQADSDCSVGSCLCNVCTITCAESTGCSDGPLGSSCVKAGELPLSCSGVPSVGLCLAPEGSAGGASAASGPPSRLDQTLELLLRDLEAQPAEARPFTRYLSAANLRQDRLSLLDDQAAGVPPEELPSRAAARGRRAVAKLTNSLSMLPEATVPVAIDVDGLYHRIDLRAYGWSRAIRVDGVEHADGWEAIVARASLALEYEGPAADRLAELSGTRIPWLFANDFVSSAGTGNTYYELLGLPQTVDELHVQLQAGEPLVAPRQRAAFESSGHSFHARVVERRSLAAGREVWQTFDFAAEEHGTAVFRSPLAFEHAHTELIFELPNGLNAFFMADGRGQRISEAGELRYSLSNPAERDGVQRSAAGCFGCHNQGIVSFTDELRDAWSSPAIGAGPEQAAVFEAYPPASFLSRAVADDSADYQAALGRVGIEERTRDAVSRLYYGFTLGDVPRDLAAEELFTSEETLAQEVAGLPRVLAGIAGPEGAVSRAVFVGAYRDAMCTLHRAGQNKPVGCR